MPSRARFAGPIMLALAGTALDGAAADGSPWQVSSSRNPVRGGTIGIAEAAVPGIRASVRCESAQTWIDVRFFVDGPADRYTGDVSWTFDDDDDGGRTERWRMSPNRASLIVPPESQGEFLQRMRVNRQLSLVLHDDEDEEYEFSIPLRGSMAAIDEALRDCR